MRVSISSRTPIILRCVLGASAVAPIVLVLGGTPAASASERPASANANICRDAVFGPQSQFCGQTPPPAIPPPPTPVCTIAVLGTAVSVDWTLVPNPNSPISSFSVERGTSPATLSIVKNTPPSTSSYTDQSLAPGTYYYEIVAIGAYGESGSLECSATVPLPAATPSGPSGPLPPPLIRRHPPT